MWSFIGFNILFIGVSFGILILLQIKQGLVLSGKYVKYLEL